ncbi:hypothetical protein GCM10027342_14330 [Photobacterium alginatilyticum]
MLLNVKDIDMKRNKAKVIASWHPSNPREMAALQALLIQEIGGQPAHHQGGTGKTGNNSGRVIR